MSKLTYTNKTSLGTRGRTLNSCLVGSSSFAGGGSAKRIFQFNSQASVPPSSSGSDGVFGGGGGAGGGAEASSGNNAAPGGSGGDGVFCIYATGSPTNETGEISGNPTGNAGPSSGGSQSLTLISATSNNQGIGPTVCYTNSVYNNNTGAPGNPTYINVGSGNYSMIALGPGTYTVETNMAEVTLLLAAGGGGGAGGGLLGKGAYSGGGGGGSGGAIGGNLLLYSTTPGTPESGIQAVPNNSITTTFTITVGSGGGGGAGAIAGSTYTSPNGYFVGGQGSAGNSGYNSSMTITQAAYAQFDPITITCTGGGGGSAANLTFTASSGYNQYGNVGVGGSGGSYSYSGLSSNGIAALSQGLLISGLSGGNGAYSNGSTFLAAQPGTGSAGTPPTNIATNSFYTPAANIQGDNATINVGGGGGGGNTFTGTTLINQGGSGGGGNGGSVPNITSNPFNIFLAIWDGISEVSETYDTIVNIATVCLLIF